MVENAESCVLGLDDQALVRLSNGFTSERLGLTSSQLLGSSFVALCQPADLQDAVERALNGERVRDHECVHHTPSGPRIIRWVLRPLSPVASGLRSVEHQDQSALRLLAVGQDITERLELERKNPSEAMAGGHVTTWA